MLSQSTKYIFVTGGVVSGLGKGITAASLGRLLKARGYKVTIQKFDPYINVDPGTMSPYQHGEVFVTEDGAETDLDLGHYERYIDENLSVNSSNTAGKIYWNVINRERKGEYLGATVQVIPHITNEIKERIYKVGRDAGADIVITEIGGTVGDIESLPFLEAIRQVSTDVGRKNAIFIHVTLVPFIAGSNELKSKPTQHSVKELLSIGIQPNIIVCRSDIDLPVDMRNKISLFCNVRAEDVISNLTAPTIYAVPLMLEEGGLAHSVCHHLNLPDSEPDLAEWHHIAETAVGRDKTVTIGLVGKYVELPDAYLSVMEALSHGGIANNVNVDIKLISSASITDDTADELLGGLDGIIVPGGFGERGSKGIIRTARYARENNVPYFGICLGMQMATVEFAQNVLGLATANSREFAENCEHPVIDLMENQRGVVNKGGTMRLGSYPCRLDPTSRCYEIYGQNEVQERHRHRYEFNNDYRERFQQAGLLLAGLSPDDHLVEIVELRDHRWFIGVQFHPEFKSRPNRAHPLFKSFIRVSLQS